MTDLLKYLNEEQKKIVTETEGPQIILAGAGSGKTRVLTYKVAYLIAEKKISPQNILMVTFTNKAAGEMKNRLKKLVPNKFQPWASTFHSFSAKILRKEGKYIGLSPNYVIYDEQDQLEAIKEILRIFDINSKNIHPKSVLATISQAKNELISGKMYSEFARGYFQEIVFKVYLAYEELLKKNNALDFDDLLFETVNLFKKNPSVLQKYQETFKYILVDEYQDTNHAQYTLTKLLGQRYKNVCIVGDASQSIYSWRGADFRNIVNFQNDFPKAKVFYLEQNYRSTKKILEAASKIISNNSTHPVLNLWTQNSKGENITLYEARSETDEANFIILTINNFINNNSYTIDDFAVLYRTNAQSRVIEEAFLHNSMPYTLIGGVRFYDRKEIKDVLSYLKFLYNPKDAIAYRRLEKIGKKRLEKFIEIISGIKKENVNNLNTLETMDKIIAKVNYLDLYDPKNEEDLQRLENIKELRSVATQFNTLSEFLENVALVEQEYLPSGILHNPSKQKSSVKLMTIHAAKGLEFKIVFLVGLEEGLFPHSQSLMDRLELEEERRLCYVAVTRAMEYLFLTYARRRLFFGSRTANMPSRFISEIPEHILSFKTDNSLFLS